MIPSWRVRGYSEDDGLRPRATRLAQIERGIIHLQYGNLAHGLRELDDDTLCVVAGILVRREDAAREAGKALDAACHGAAVMIAQQVMCERGLGFHPDVCEFLARDEAQQ